MREEKKEENAKIPTFNKARKVSIDGRIYWSVYLAVQAYKCNRTTVADKCNSIEKKWGSNSTKVGMRFFFNLVIEFLQLVLFNHITFSRFRFWLS